MSRAGRLPPAGPARRRAPAPAAASDRPAAASDRLGAAAGRPAAASRGPAACSPLRDAGARPAAPRPAAVPEAA